MKRVMFFGLMMWVVWSCPASSAVRPVGDAFSFRAHACMSGERVVLIFYIAREPKEIGVEMTGMDGFSLRATAVGPKEDDVLGVISREKYVGNLAGKMVNVRLTDRAIKDASVLRSVVYPDIADVHDCKSLGILVH